MHASQNAQVALQGRLPEAQDVLKSSVSGFDVFGADCHALPQCAFATAVGVIVSDPMFQPSI
jgi:hypothetical protein